MQLHMRKAGRRCFHQSARAKFRMLFFVISTVFAVQPVFGDSIAAFYKTSNVVSNFDSDLLVTNSEGVHPSSSFRVFYNYNGRRISPWHDIPMRARQTENGSKLYHFICEIPLGTTAKMEVNKKMVFNPIAQDKTDDGGLRFYKYKPENGSLCNYGAITQTWGDPRRSTGFSLRGDNDPIDALQLNKRPCIMASYLQLKCWVS